MLLTGKSIWKIPKQTAKTQDLQMKNAQNLRPSVHGLQEDYGNKNPELHRCRNWFWRKRERGFPLCQIRRLVRCIPFRLKECLPGSYGRGKRKLPYRRRRRFQGPFHPVYRKKGAAMQRYALWRYVSELHFPQSGERTPLLSLRRHMVIRSASEKRSGSVYRM